MFPKLKNERVARKKAAAVASFMKANPMCTNKSIADHFGMSTTWARHYRHLAHEYGHYGHTSETQKTPIELLDDAVKNWQSPGFTEVTNTYIDYSSFVTAFQNFPLSEWPENYDGHVYKVYIFYACDTDYNSFLINNLRKWKPKVWHYCWWSSNREGRHEFRVPLKPTEEEWKYYYGKEMDDAVEDRKKNMKKNLES